jgi:hypothetical protein
MSNKLSLVAAEILNRVKDALQAAEELGGTDGTDDYLALMEEVATLAVEQHNAANSERGCGEVGYFLRLTKIGA